MVIEAPDETFMRQALRLAGRAGARGEIPVAAVLTLEGKVVARAANATICRQDPTAHAEVRVLRKAARLLDNHRLGGVILYVTLEPCLMCIGAMIQARTARCVFGAADPKIGASSLLGISRVRLGINHRFPLEGGCLEKEAAELLRAFFRSRGAGPGPGQSLS